MSPHELKAFEDALKALAPSPPAINRDRLMYQAGKSAAPAPRGWQAATAVLSCLVVALAATSALRPPPPAQERVVYVRVHAQPPEPPPPSLPEGPPSPEQEQAGPSFTVSAAIEPMPRYRRAQENVIRWGLYGVPAPPAIPKPDEAQSLDTMLDSL
jgi:hypothetical protein